MVKLLYPAEVNVEGITLTGIWVDRDDLSKSLTNALKGQSFITPESVIRDLDNGKYFSDPASTKAGVKHHFRISGPAKEVLFEDDHEKIFKGPPAPEFMQDPPEQEPAVKVDDDMPI